MDRPSSRRETPLCLPPFRGEDPGVGAYQTASAGSRVEDRGSVSNSINAVLTPERGETEGGLSPRGRFRSSPALSRRQALFGVSAAVLAAGIGIHADPASAATVFASVQAELTDMTGHTPGYNATIGFGRPKASAALIDDPYDLIFA
jgi:hypothetical protein